MSREEAEAEDSKKKSDDMRLQMAIQKSKENDEPTKEEKKPQSALSDLVDLNFGGPAVTTTGPHPPQRTAASRDPWSPLAENGSSGGPDPWGGMGPIISSSTIPDPWGGIGGVGVPPSRGSPLVFGAASSTSPPSAGKTNPDPWSAPAPAPSNNDPWGETPARGETDCPPSRGQCNYNSVPADPFSPGGPTDPNDVMAAFGGGGGGASKPNGGFGSGVSPVPGAGAQVAANPWDLGGLDPLPLLGPNNTQVVRPEA